MSDRQFESAPAAVRTSQMIRQAAASGPTPLQRERAPLQTGNCNGAALHAALIHRATSRGEQAAAQSVLHLQRQYGNRYVEHLVARARENAEPNQVHPTVERTIHQQRGGGQNLDSGVRQQMESSMGADFSRVRVHTGSTANTLNHALSARAFTTGNDIFFRQGAYQPGSFVGRELLAHELTHVVQQNGSSLSRAMSVSQPGDAHEMEAEHTAHAVMQRELHPAVDSGAAGVSRQDDKDGMNMASRCPDDARRQPEAVHEDEDKKKHHASRQAESQLARAEDEHPE